MVSIPSSGGDRTTLGVVILTCPERPGIVQAITSFLLRHDFDIVEHHQFDDCIREILFLRTAFAAKQPSPSVSRYPGPFAGTASTALSRGSNCGYRSSWWMSLIHLIY